MKSVSCMQVVKRKSTAISQSGASDGSQSGTPSGASEMSPAAAEGVVKKPAPKRSKPSKPKSEGVSGGMDSAAIADAAARAVAGSLMVSHDNTSHGGNVEMGSHSYQLVKPENISTAPASNATPSERIVHGHANLHAAHGQSAPVYSTQVNQPHEDFSKVPKSAYAIGNSTTYQNNYSTSHDSSIHRKN